MYDPKSMRAEDFISHQEVLDTLGYAWENRRNAALIDGIIKKAKLRKGLSHREAAVLLTVNWKTGMKRYMRLPNRSKRLLWQPIVLFAPLTFQLLRQWLRLLPVSYEKQAYHKKENDPG